MYGMPLSQALVFLIAVIIIIVATQRRHFHPFLVIVVVAAVFGFIAGFPTSYLARVFGAGFSEMIYSPGLVIIAAGFIAGLAESTAAADRLKQAFDRWRWLGGHRIAAGLGLIAGIGASPAAAFALLTPLLPALSGDTAQKRDGSTIALALALSASHGVAVLTPVPIAAAAILGAEWSRVALFGLPLALVLAAFAAIFAQMLPVAGAGSQPLPQPSSSEPMPSAGKQSAWPAIVLVLAVAIPLVMLMVQSLGDIPSEPLGGGPARELVLASGRPLILFLVGIGIMIAGQPRQSLGLLADSTWTGRVLGNLASILLIVCAAGGFQHLCQETGMAEMFGERLIGWHVEAVGGVLVPFLVAAAIKTLQGSSLVAAITAAGMVQPLLLPLGLDGTNGKALAALAIGAGAMTISHVNDEYFWLVADRAGLPPLRGLATISLGTLLQGLIAAAALLVLSLLIGHG
jgi:GntP family gluconate:H+ symporter